MELLIAIVGPILTVFLPVIYRALRIRYLDKRYQSKPPATEINTTQALPIPERRSGNDRRQTGNRRKAEKRFPLKVPVLYKVDGQHYVGESCDVSSSGVKILAERGWRVNDSIGISFKNRELDQFIPARVAWSCPVESNSNSQNSFNSYIGLAFDTILPEHPTNLFPELSIN